MFDEAWFENLEISLDEDKFFDGRIFKLRPSLTDIDFGTSRPLKKLSSTDLSKFSLTALSRPWPAVELATLGYDEAKICAEKGGNAETVDLIAAKFQKIGKAPITWLSDARKQLKSVVPRAKNGSGLGSVYFVLVEGFSEQNQFYGCYVGQTRTTNLGDFNDNQSARIASHFKGIRASKRVKNRGLEPLWSLNFYTDGLADDTEEILDYETKIHQCLEQVIPKVLGDVQPN